jgi:hypothetical protein
MGVCKADSIKYSKQSWYDTASFDVGSDGDISMEWIQMEALQRSQFDDPLDNKPFWCGVRQRMSLRCLDVAASTTLSIGPEGDNPWRSYNYTTTNIFSNEKVFQLLSPKSLDYNNNVSYTGNMFGMQEECDGLRTGDGQINGFDMFVLASAYFEAPPYKQLFTDDEDLTISDIETVYMRPMILELCDKASEQENAPWVSRAEWQLRIARDSCYTPDDEAAYQCGINEEATFQIAHVMDHMVTSETQWGGDTCYYFTAFAASKNSGYEDMEDLTEVCRMPLSQVITTIFDYDDDEWQFTATMDNKTVNSSSIISDICCATCGTNGRRRLQEKKQQDDLGIVVSRRTASQECHKGYWTTIHIPRIVISVEIFVEGLEAASKVVLSNAPVPDYNTSFVPENPGEFDMRFERHLEVLDRKDISPRCAVIAASGSASFALHRGIISVSQYVNTGQNEARPLHLCGFNLVVWTPAAHATSFPPDGEAQNCNIRVLAGSSAIDGRFGSTQQSDACMTLTNPYFAVGQPPLPSSSPPSSSPPSSSPPSSSPPSSSPPSSSLPSSSDDDSLATIIAIVVPVSVGILCLAGVGFFWWCSCILWPQRSVEVYLSIESTRRRNMEEKDTTMKKPLLLSTAALPVAPVPTARKAGKRPEQVPLLSFRM